MLTSTLHQIISDAIDLQLSDEGSGRDVSTRNLATAVEAAILNATGGPDHLIHLKGTAWTIQHPISERFEDGGLKLFNCQFTLLAQNGIPVIRREGSGKFRLWLDRNSLMWEKQPDRG